MRLIDEKKLLERDPIIAPDGYIPNSVIRRKLKPPKHEPPVRVERRWKLKPVPKADPKYMPKGWGTVEKEKERTPPPSLVVRKWEDTPTPTASDRSVASSLSSVSLKSTPPTPPRLLKKFIRECHAKPKSESKSAKTAIAESKSRENTQASTVTLTPPFVENKSLGDKKYSRENSLSERVIHWTPSPKPGSAAAASPDVTHYDIESQSPTKVKVTPVNLLLGQTGAKPGDARSKQTSSEMLEELRRKRKLAQDRAKLTDVAVEEESEEMKKQKSIMESELIKHLLDEKWMPIVDPSVEDYGNVLAKLLRLLDDHNPMVYNSVIDYLIALYKELGIIAEILDSIIAKLGANLNSLNIAIKRHTLRGLQVVGTGRTDVLKMILPKLIDEEEAVRKAAAEAILVLTGAKDKETLFAYLDSHGVTEGIYNSKEDEEFAFRVLAERLAEGAEDPAYFDRLEARIMDWVERTTPGLISEDMNPEDLEEQLWKNGSRKSSMYKSREQSFMSEKSGVMTSGMTMYADLPGTPGFSSELSELCLSRGVSKSGELKSAASRYNARMGLMDLMDRSGAVHVPGERWEPPTPVTCSESSEHDPTPSLILHMEKSNLTNQTNDSRCSKQSFDNTKLTEERTLTNLSQVGPLPSFMRRGNSDGKSYDAISTDSAIESGFSASEYEGLSHYSEMLTFSHTDQQSFKDSVLSETNEIFDAEHESEADLDADATEQADDTLQIDADDNTEDDNGEIAAEKLLGIYFDENLDSIVEVVEEVILTPVPGIEGLSLLAEEDEEDDDETTPRERGSVDSESRVMDTRSTISQRLHDGSIISEGSTSSPDTTAHESKMPEQQAETEAERGSSVMVIITPRGEIVKSVISVEGNHVTPRDVVQDTIMEEKSFEKTVPIDPQSKTAPIDTKKTAPIEPKSKIAPIDPQKKHICYTPPSLKLSSYVDKGTNVTERSFAEYRTRKRSSPRVNQEQVLEAATVAKSRLPSNKQNIDLDTLSPSNKQKVDLDNINLNIGKASLYDDLAPARKVGPHEKISSRSKKESCDSKSSRSQNTNASMSRSTKSDINAVAKIEISRSPNIATGGKEINESTFNDDVSSASSETSDILASELKLSVSVSRSGTQIVPEKETKAKLLENQMVDIEKDPSKGLDNSTVPLSDSQAHDLDPFKYESEDLDLVSSTDLHLSQYIGEEREKSRITPRDPHFFRVFDSEPKPGPGSHEEQKEERVQAEASSKFQYHQIPTCQLFQSMPFKSNGYVTKHRERDLIMDVLPSIRRYKRSGIAKIIDNKSSVNSDNFVKHGTSFNNNSILGNNITRSGRFNNKSLVKNRPLLNGQNIVRNRDSSFKGQNFVGNKEDLFRGYDIVENRPLSSSWNSVENGSSPNSYMYEYYFERAKEKEIMERLSGQDSGIGQDISSELSQKGKVPPHGALSPVKSEESITTNRQQQQKQQQQHETLDKDWRKFFELPTAIERQQMELIKHELAQGKLKQTQLPPISYFARDLPMLPGEAGTRLLQTVRVGEKEVTSGDGRHRIQPVPGKLAVHTQNESEGSSCFGIIQMEWTTGVPTMKDPTHPPQRLPRYRLITEETAQYLPPLHTRLSQLSHLDRMRLGTSDTDLHLPNLTTASSTPTASQRLSPSVSHRLSPGFEWELPLPPPPAKESRTVIPYIKKEHDTYCKYYQLVKKKLHLYTSHLGFIPALIAAEKARPPPKKQRERSLSLPTVITKSMTGNQHTDGTRLHHRSRDNSNLTMGTGQQLLPPIKLGQLINI